MFGNTTGSKMNIARDNGWNVGWTVDMKPFPAMLRTTNIYVTKGTNNPAGARLFISYALGGENPNNRAENLPQLQYGSWSLRSDYVDKVNDVSVFDIPFVMPDSAGIYDTYLDVSDFWVYWSNHFRKK